MGLLRGAAGKEDLRSIIVNVLSECLFGASSSSATSSSRSPKRQYCIVCPKINSNQSSQSRVADPLRTLFLSSSLLSSSTDKKFRLKESRGGFVSSASPTTHALSWKRQKDREIKRKGRGLLECFRPFCQRHPVLRDVATMLYYLRYNPKAFEGICIHGHF